MQESQSSTIVVGIGNIIRSDDGLGVHALRLLQSAPGIPGDVVFLDGGTLGLELVSYLMEASRLLVIDSVNAGQAAGTLIRMSGDEVRCLRGGMTVHHLGVVDLVASLTFACERPPDIVLLGIQPASTDWGISLTPRVEAALAALVEMALAVLQSWSEEGKRPGFLAQSI